MLNKTLKLNHFRYQARNPKSGEFIENPKAIVFYVHGYGDYASRYAYVGEYLSNLGIEFAGLDQRGFGTSEGSEGKIESFETNVDDNLEFHSKYCLHFSYLKNVPKFMLSGSFGAQLILYCHLKKPDFYTGIAMGGPYFRHHDEELHQKLMPYINFITNFVNRDYRMNFGYDTK